MGAGGGTHSEFWPCPFTPQLHMYASVQPQRGLWACLGPAVGFGLGFSGTPAEFSSSPS